MHHNNIYMVGRKITEELMTGKEKATKNTEMNKKKKKRVRPEGRGTLLWPLSFPESMRGMKYPVQNPDRQTMELQL